MSDARSLVDEFGERLGWNAETRLDMLCNYVDNQRDSDCLFDYLQQLADEEESYHLEDEEDGAEEAEEDTAGDNK